MNNSWPTTDWKYYCILSGFYEKYVFSADSALCTGRIKADTYGRSALVGYK
jgi:hypothetical protein